MSAENTPQNDPQQVPPHQEQLSRANTIEGALDKVGRPFQAPDLEDLADLYDLIAGVREEADGTFYDSDDNVVAPAVFNRAQKAADPKTWILNKEETTAAREILKAKELKIDNLSPDQKEGVVTYMNIYGVSEGTALKRYRSWLGKSINLSGYLKKTAPSIPKDNEPAKPVSAAAKQGKTRGKGQARPDSKAKPAPKRTKPEANRPSAADIARQRQLSLEAVYGKVIRFMNKPGSEFAAGPMVKKEVGLGFEDIQKLGFNSLDDLKTAARTWQTERTARGQAIKEANLIKKQQLADERQAAAQRNQYRATGQAQAAAWKSDVDAIRQQRAQDQTVRQEQIDIARAQHDEAAQRVEALVYRDKLLNGGEIGLRRNLSVSAEEIRQAAEERAKAEGYSLDTVIPGEDPRLVSVTQNAAAEKRQAELAGLLRDHDRAMLLSNNDLMPDGKTADGRSDKNFDANDPTAWQKDPNSVFKSSLPEADKAPVDNGADAEPIEPVKELTKPSLRNRMKKIFGQTRDKLLKLYVETENRLVSPHKHNELSEKQLQHRRWIMNAGIGSLVVYKVWAAYNGIHSGGSGGSELAKQMTSNAPTGAAHGQRAVNTLQELTGGGAGTSGNKTLSASEIIGELSGHNSDKSATPMTSTQLMSELAGGTASSSRHSSGSQTIGGLARAAAEQGSTTGTLHHGETIWADLAKYAEGHGAHPDNAKLQRMVDQTLRHNGLSWDDSSRLPSGYHFDIPAAVLSELNNPDKVN